MVIVEWLSKFGDLGGTAVLAIGILFILWKSIERYPKVIEDNTKAMTKVADSNTALKEAIENQTDLLEKQGVMYQQNQNFMMQIIAQRGVDNK